MPPTQAGGEVRLVLPIEITVRVGTPDAPPLAAAVAAAPLAAPRPLLRRAEAIRVDADYASRPGYDPAFLDGHDIPLPEPGARMRREVAPLRAEEPDAAKGVLRYQHFSVVVNKARRMALFSATNVDGETYLAVDRDTGEAEGAEGDKWFRDPRISTAFVLEQEFYSAWSSYFDRGHVTRRTDPTWGTPEDAERANADTFHFTNCTPQHFRFNQSARFWQGAERYVLERGALRAGIPARLCVIQGPIFSDAVDRWADDIQIPSSFFKVVAWVGQAGLRSVALVVDQHTLLDEARVNIGRPKDVAVNVAQWRVPVRAVERRTGLDLGEAIRAADTIAEGGQPTVGEAQLAVRSFEDLLPR